MDDIEKAIIMSVQILMFVFALTIAVVVYYKLNTNIKNIILESDYSSREDAIINKELASDKREVSRAEVMMAILNMDVESTPKVQVGGYLLKIVSGDATVDDGGYVLTNTAISYGIKNYDRASVSFANFLRDNVFAGTTSNTKYNLTSYNNNTLVYRKVSP